MICPKCHHELRKGAKFCDGCGSDISRASQLERKSPVGNYEKYDIEDDFEDTIITGPGGMPAKGKEDKKSKEEIEKKGYEDVESEESDFEETIISKPNESPLVRKTEEISTKNNYEDVDVDKDDFEETIITGPGGDTTSSKVEKKSSSEKYEEYKRNDKDLEETLIEKNVEQGEEQDLAGPKEVIGGRYEVVKELGRGGFAEVFQGRDKNLDRLVAIKRLLTHLMDHDSSEEILERFKIEAMSIAKLKHRNIVEVYDYDYDDKGYYIVMEYIDGGSLSDYIKKSQKVEPQESVEFCKGIAQGLYYAHRNKLIHRDIKPDNVMIVTEDGKPVPKIVDFGLARAGQESELSVTGYAMGTPGYMAPEQRRDAKNVDHRADIYSLGKVLYKLLTGEKPQDVIPTLIPPPQALNDIIFKCINPKPEDRYFSMDGLIKDLDNISFRDTTAKKRDTMQLIRENICPACDTGNHNSDKFCANCGEGLTMACPECERENSIHRAFCTGCGSDIPLFNTAAEALQRMNTFKTDKKWSRVVKEFSLLPKDLQFHQPNGIKMLEEASQLHNDAKKKIVLRDELKEKLDSTLESNQYRSALEIIDQYKDLNPEDSVVLNLPEKLRFKVLKSLFVEKTKELDDALSCKKLTVVREVIDELKTEKEEFKLPDDKQWNSEWQEKFKLLEDQDNDLKGKEEEISQLINHANQLFENQDYKACIEKCSEANEISSDSKEIIELKTQSENIEKEINSKFSIAQTKFSEHSWIEVNEICNGILKLQKLHSEAIELKEKAVVKINFQKNVRKALLSLAAILVVGLVIWAGLFWKARYEKAKSDAQLMFKERTDAAMGYYNKAKSNLLIDGFKTVQLLTNAVQEIDLASKDELVKFLGKGEKSEFNTFKDTVFSFKSSVEKSRKLYDINYNEALAALTEGKIFIKENPERAYKLYQPAFNKLVELQKEEINSLLETQKRSAVIDVKKQIEQNLTVAVFNFAEQSKTKADNVHSESSDAYKEAIIKLAGAKESLEKNLIMEAADLALGSAELFNKSIETYSQSKELQKYRDPLMSKLNKVDFSVLEKHTPNKLAKMRQARQAGEEKVKNYEYGGAIGHYKEALVLLDDAVDIATDQLLKEGNSNPFQIQFFNKAKRVFGQELDKMDRGELEKYCADKLNKINADTSQAEQAFLEKKYVKATDIYENLLMQLHDAKITVNLVKDLLKNFFDGMREGIGMLTKAQHTNDQNERNKILDDIITLLAEINRNELTGIIDNKTKTEFGNLYSTSKKLLEDPQSFYEKDLLEVKKYIEAAKLDVIKQKSPRENVLVSLNYLNSAVEKGFFPADAKKYKLEFFEIQLQSLINNNSDNSAELLFELRSWISLALKELNLSLDELEREMKLTDMTDMTDSILPPGYQPVDDSYEVKVKKNQAVWFKMYPQTVKSSSGMEFCLVPPGKFIMGNKESKFETEKPEHEIVLDTPFYMGRFELMVGEFREFAQKHLDLTLFDNNDVIVAGINYVSALRFCNWLSKKHDLKSAYICSAEDEKKSNPEDWKVDLNTSGYRLPTEAEWEYVAKYSLDDNQEVSLVDTAWFGDTAGGQLLRGNIETLTENNIKPNYLGIYCMRGNVLELVSDWFGTYENKPATNPVRQLDSSVKSRHIGRGGHVGSSDVEISTTYRKRIHPEIEKPQNLGIRLVIPLRFEKIIDNN